jgi:hypothetical protein
MYYLICDTLTDVKMFFPLTYLQSESNEKGFQSDWYGEGGVNWQFWIIFIPVLHEVILECNQIFYHIAYHTKW